MGSRGVGFTRKPIAASYCGSFLNQLIILFNFNILNVCSILHKVM
jgi:hypothetical protein